MPVKKSVNKISAVGLYLHENAQRFQVKNIYRHRSNILMSSHIALDKFSMERTGILMILKLISFSICIMLGIAMACIDSGSSNILLKILGSAVASLPLLVTAIRTLEEYNKGQIFYDGEKYLFIQSKNINYLQCKKHISSLFRGEISLVPEQRVLEIIKFIKDQDFHVYQESVVALEYIYKPVLKNFQNSNTAKFNDLHCFIYSFDEKEHQGDEATIDMPTNEICLPQFQGSKFEQCVII